MKDKDKRNSVLEALREGVRDSVSKDKLESTGDVVSG